MTLKDYMERLGWNASRLAQEARLDVRTARRAMKGESILAANAEAIATAISAAIGERILVGDIQGLEFR